MAELPSLPEGILVTHFIVSDDVEGQTTDPDGDWSPAHWASSTPTEGE